MTNSEISTDPSTFRPWHFFVLGALVAATAGVLLARPGSPANLILLSLGIGAAGLAGLGLYRTLVPLVGSDVVDGGEMIGRRTRAALEREKTLVLRSIKELEFDRAMGKLSEQDFQEMSGRLRSRAITLLKQLDTEGRGGYAELIEQELRTRLARTRKPRAVEATMPAHSTPVARVCAVCETPYDPDARFCKQCGARIGQGGK